MVRLLAIDVSPVILHDCFRCTGPDMAALRTGNRLPDLWRLIGKTLCPTAQTQVVASYTRHPGVVAKVAELLHWFALHGTAPRV